MHKIRFTEAVVGFRKPWNRKISINKESMVIWKIVVKDSIYCYKKVSRAAELVHCKGKTNLNSVDNHFLVPNLDIDGACTVNKINHNVVNA